MIFSRFTIVIVGKIGLNIFHRTGDKPLPVPMMNSSLHIYLSPGVTEIDKCRVLFKTITDNMTMAENAIENIFLV